MKLNWKIALVCLAAVTMVACKDKKDDETSGGGTSGGGTDPSYVSPINVKDKSVADWDALDATKVGVSTITNQPLWPAIKQLKVYADEVYINYMLVIDPNLYVSHTPSDAMHIYMNSDNNNNTGGFFDSFSDAGVDLMFEGPLFDDNESPISYAPVAHKWAGPEGKDGYTEEERTGDWMTVWVSAGTVRGESQFIGDSIIEGRLLVDLIPGGFAGNEFGIGFDLQQNWENAGLLPQLNTPNGVNVGRTTMLYVKFDK